MAKALTVTATGTLSGFTALETPSTKFDTDGVYSCQAEFTGADAKKLKGIIDKIMAESLAAGGKRGVKRAANPPYTVENKVLTVKFKQKAIIRSKDGRTFDMSIKLYDAKGTLLTEDVGISAGSEVKIAFSSYTWAVAALGCGATLQPNSIQIIKLVKYQAASANPFGAEEGYEAKKNDNPFEGVAADDEMDEQVDNVADVVDVDDDEDDF